VFPELLPGLLLLARKPRFAGSRVHGSEPSLTPKYFVVLAFAGDYIRGTMRAFLPLFALTLTASVVTISTAQNTATAPAHNPVLFPGLGTLHHPTSTRSQEAQQFFDQGLRLVYAFNHEEANRSFQHALQLDPKFAMAWWGIAVAVGPNYNLPVDADREKIAANAVQHALDLSHSATPVEQDYIKAIATRFSSTLNPDYSQLNLAYSRAMRTLARKYPDDLDAFTLFADSLMNLRPWRLWNSDGTPAEGTPEIIATLESVLRRDPNHIGAMHLYLHAVEASPNPERALSYANSIATLAPGAGHLVHMPSHIYMRTGNYDGARAQNAAAAHVDEQYIAATGAQGVYPLMYYSHNLHFLAIAAATQGRCGDAVEAAQRLTANVQPAVKEMPMLEAFLGIRYAIAVRCRRWDDLLSLQPPSAKTPALRAFWLYGHGCALAARSQLTQAEAEEKELASVVKATPRDEIFLPPVENHSWQIFHIADDLLAARIAIARGNKPAAIALLRDAVTNQDQLLYDEPPDWYYDTRETLGGVLIESRDAVGAEQVFRESLSRNPRNPRSLFGLSESLKRQGRDYEAAWVQKQFETSWQGADVSLTMNDL
jgi:tetratricopeptide (TPR) repeat protein